MPQTVIAISLKMYLDHLQTMQWARRVREIALHSKPVLEGRAELVVFPSYPSIETLVGIFEGSPISVGAQNMAPTERGAYTGEVSVHTLKQVGCTYIELGHAERRRLFGETQIDIQQKISLALTNQ